MFSERDIGEPPEPPQRLSLQSYNLRVDLEVAEGQWREQVFALKGAEPIVWAVWRDRPSYLAGQQVTVCGWLSPPPVQRFLHCELEGKQGRVELTLEGAFLLSFPAPARTSRLRLALPDRFRDVPVVVTAGAADFAHDGATLRILAPTLAGQPAELQLQRLPIDSCLNGAYDDFEFVAADPARVQLRQAFDAQGQLSVQCNSKTAGIFEVAGKVGDISLYHRWLHLPEGGRLGRRLCRTLEAFDQVTLQRFGQTSSEIERVDMAEAAEEPALGMDLEPPGPFVAGEQAVLRIALNGSPWGVGFLCWWEATRLISWGVVSLQEGLNGLLAQIPLDCRWGQLSLSLHILAPGRQLEARLGLVLRPVLGFACDWNESLTVHLSDDHGAPLPHTTVLARIASTPWVERQPGWNFDAPFQVLPSLAEPFTTPLAAEPECAGSSAPSWTFLGRSDGEGKVSWPAPRTPGATLHLSARDSRGAWAEAYVEG